MNNVEYKGFYHTKLKTDYPEFQEYLDEFAYFYLPKSFKWHSVTINKNFKCPPHKDINNTTESLIVGLGDYDGGDLCIEDHKTGEVSKHCIWRSPLYFNGKDNRHWTDDYTGTRYTVVLGNAKFIAHRDGGEKQKMNSQICADGCG